MIKKTKYQISGAYAFLILAQVMVGINIVGSKYLVASVRGWLQGRTSMCSCFSVPDHKP